MRRTPTPFTPGSSLPQELFLGRIGMVATFGILVVRELPGYRFMQLDRQIVLGTAILAMAAVWMWFWLALAAMPDRASHGVAVALITTAATVLVVARPMGVFPLYYAVIVAGAAYKWRIGAALAALVAILTAIVWWQTEIAGPWTLSEIVITVLLGGAAVIVRRYIGVQIELYETRDELRRLAVAEARHQLARDLHDRLGQNLTSTVMQGELLAMDLPADISPEIKDRTRLIVESSREALTLMREMVTEARNPSMRSEVEVARQLLEAAGITCQTRGEHLALPTVTDSVFGWIIREGATNVLRHSRATHCDITIDLRHGNHVLSIADNGQGADGALPGNGYSHMAERIGAAGGRMEVTPASGTGHTITAAIPTT